MDRSLLTKHLHHPTHVRLTSSSSNGGSNVPPLYRKPLANLPFPEMRGFSKRQMNLETAFCMDYGQVKTGENQADTFVKMLQEIVRVTLPMARTVADDYPNVVALVRGFREHGPYLLEDLKVRTPLSMSPDFFTFSDDWSMYVVTFRSPLRPRRLPQVVQRVYGHGSGVDGCLSRA